MVRKSSVISQTLAAIPLVGAGLLSAASTAIGYAQAIPRILAPVENSRLVALPGQVHPWARAQFDRGIAPANLNGRMLIVMQRSPAQEAALQQLLAEQQDPHSPNYHRWLTPELFGKQFGVADADVQTVSGYLASQGMTVRRVYGSHMALQVEGTAGQIGSAFQTEIHSYSVGGKMFYANATAPKIPSALRGVISGFASLNNFRVAGGSGAGTSGTLDPATHLIKPLYSLTGSNAGTYGVAPGDLSAIYDIPAATAQGQGGANVKIGVIGDSNINLGYINNYRSIFGLSVNPPVVVVDGNDPGINDDAYIAYKQIELLGAVAPNAKIYYYTSADTDYDIGLNFALIRAVEDNQVQVLVNGFQSCEKTMGIEVTLVNTLYEQAAAEGMTVVAAAGNTGSAGCEIPGTAGPSATGFAVNGYASSPFATAVGGTDFYYTASKPATNYWATTNSSTYKSAKATVHIPEQAWNDSNVTATASNPSVKLAGGGGVSSVGLDGVSTPQPIPAYQSANAKASAIGNTARVLPDVSFFAGSGANDSMGYNSTAYVFCMTSADCQTGSGSVQFTYSGGTEASSAVFAGAVALAVNYVNGSSQFGLGNINPTLYAQFGSPIVSYDITIGNNELKCSGGGANNCSQGTMTGYKTAAGYDAATGLGSFDITSFVSNYAPSATSTLSSLSLAVTDAATNLPPVCTSGGTVTTNCSIHSYYLKFVVTATGSGATPTGDVAILTTNPLAGMQNRESLTLSNGTATDPGNNLLPGGTYQIYARYAGDATYKPSTSLPYTITIKPEACGMVTYGHNISASTSTMAYGSPVTVTVEPYSVAYGNAVALPTGSINVFDSYTSGSTPITTLPINSEGAATFTSNLLAFGAHSIVFTYPGDASFSTCSTSAFNVSIAKANTITLLNAPENDTGAGTNTIGITAVVESSAVAANQPSNGTAPTGTVTFSTKTPKTAQLFAGFDPNGNAIATASIQISQSDLPTGNNHSITATYTPANTELNYNGSTSAAVPFQSTVASRNDPTFTSFTITDNNGGPYPADGRSLSFPAQDSLTLNLTVTSASNPDYTRFLVYANGVELTPPITKDGNGIVTGGGLKPNPDGTATFVVPQQNGYLALPSGQVQFTVIYDGWYSAGGFLQSSQESDPSSANQVVTIIDDRTSADFSLQSDITVNQQQPLVSPTMQATYNLRLTSIYNFQSAYSTTPINLSCSVIGYTNTSGVRSTPAGLACGFSSDLSAQTASPTFAANGAPSGFIVQQLYVGAASGYGIASNSTTALPAARWWLATGGTTLACIFLLGLPSRRRSWQSLLGACVVLIASFGITGCGTTIASGPNQQYYSSLNGGNSGGSLPPGQTAVSSGIYTVLVTATTATNTTLVHTLPIQVKVGN